MSEKNKKSLNLLEKLILKFKKTKTTYSEKELERILEKKEKELTEKLIKQLKLEVKMFEVAYKSHDGQIHKLQLDIVSLLEGLFQHCNNKEDFSSIIMIRELIHKTENEKVEREWKNN